MHKTCRYSGCMFVDRVKELKLLEDSLNSFKSGNKMPIAIIGLRRIGKTELIQKFRETKKDFFTPYLNLQGTTSTPQTFALDFYLSLLEEIAVHEKITRSFGGSKREKIIALSSAIGKNVYNTSMEFLNTLNSGDYNEITKSVFRTPEIISKKFGKIMFFLDEFQELEELNNYRFGDVFKIMRSVVEKQENVMYVVSGSIVSFMEKLIKGSREPFFNQFRILNLSYFTKEDSFTLIKKMLKNHRISDKAMLSLFKQTIGHPFYTTAVCERLLIESTNSINEKLVRYAVIKETLGKDGKINILFNYIFEESLKKTRRKGYLQNILLILAESQGLNLTQISNLLKKPTGQVSNYLKSLLKTGLVFEKEKKYFYRDPVFRFWVAKTQLGKDVEIQKNEKFINDYINELKEKFLRTSTELGQAKEHQVKNKLEKKLGLKLSKHLKKNIEFDLVGKKNSTWLIFEIKWKNKPANYKDIENFWKKTKKSKFKNKKLFFISKSGFTEQAKKLAEKNKIKTTTNWNTITT